MFLRSSTSRGVRVYYGVIEDYKILLQSQGLSLLNTGGIASTGLLRIKG